MDNAVATVAINAEACSSSCDLCVASCPVDILRKPEHGSVYVAYPDDCQACFLCEEECPREAIRVTTPARVPMIDVVYAQSSSEKGR